MRDDARFDRKAPEQRIDKKSHEDGLDAIPPALRVPLGEKQAARPNVLPFFDIRHRPPTILPRRFFAKNGNHRNVIGHPYPLRPKFIEHARHSFPRRALVKVRHKKYATRRCGHHFSNNKRPRTRIGKQGGWFCQAPGHWGRDYEHRGSRRGRKAPG